MGLEGGHLIFVASIGIFLISTSIAIDFDNDANADSDDGRSDGGGGGGGGPVLWKRSKFKSYAIRRMDQVSNQTIHMNSFKIDKDYNDNTPHPAYQMPLQRLSNRQISYLLKKYSMKDTPMQHIQKMSRNEKMSMLQEMIADRAKIRISRPIVFASRILPATDDLSIQPEPFVNALKRERTTIPPEHKQTMDAKRIETKKHKWEQGVDEAREEIPTKTTTTIEPTESPSTFLEETTPTELEYEVERTTEPIIEIDETTTVKPEEVSTTLTSSERSQSHEQLHEISITLRQMKHKYEAMRQKFLRRLRELNERKVKLAKRRRLHSTTPAPVTISKLANYYEKRPDIKLGSVEISEDQEAIQTHAFRPIAKFENLEKSSDIHSKSSFAKSDEAEIPASTKILPEKEPELPKEEPKSALKMFESFEKQLEQESKKSTEEVWRSHDRMSIRPLKVHSSKIAKYGFSLKEVSKKEELKKVSEKASYEEFVVPLVRKHELEVTPLNEFEEVTTPSSDYSTSKRLFMSSLSDPRSKLRPFHPDAYTSSLPRPIFVKHSSSIFSKSSEATALKPIFIPKARPPPPLENQNIVAKEVSTEFEEAETTPETTPSTKPVTEDPYLRDGDVITKTRHEGRTETDVSEAVDQETNVETKVASEDVGSTLEETHSSLMFHTPEQARIGDSSSITNMELVNKLQEEFDKTTGEKNDVQAKAGGVKIEEKHNDIDAGDLEEFAQTDEESVCDAIACSFEKENLCQWEASRDLLSPASRHYLKLMKLKHLHRNKRRTHYVQRTWHNWRGRYRNRVTGIARARLFSETNQRFAAAYVRPYQRATLTGKILTSEKATIRFRAWEATRNVQLRVCCDTTENCVFESELGIKRGTRRWMIYKATCPAGTGKVIFECVNHGVYQGACGLDDIHLFNDYCPKLIPTEEQRRRRKLVVS